MKDYRKNNNTCAIRVLMNKLAMVTKINKSDSQYGFKIYPHFLVLNWNFSQYFSLLLVFSTIIKSNYGVFLFLE